LRLVKSLGPAVAVTKMLVAKHRHLARRVNGFTERITAGAYPVRSAVELFAERGYDAVGTEDIAYASMCSPKGSPGDRAPGSHHTIGSVLRELRTGPAVHDHAVVVHRIGTAPQIP